jgi:formylglycine-generating enzyme required for sulfatase activity
VAEWPVNGEVGWPDVARRFYRVKAEPVSQSPMLILIPGGAFSMGDSFGEGYSDELPVHTVYVSAFYMDRTEVTNDAMVDVLNWAYSQGKLIVSSLAVRNAEGDPQELLDLDASECCITWGGSQFAVKAEKGSGHPCVEVSWYGAAAYCNYRSERESLTPCYDLSNWNCNWSANGYRLPTEAEWEKAARGGANGRRFPWSDADTITHGRGSYYSSSSYSYDVSPTRGYHPDYDTDPLPYTSPVGSFDPTGYGEGLYDMAGSVWEWCWDWMDGNWYDDPASGDPDTTGPAGPLRNRVVRGGSWGDVAEYARCAFRLGTRPSRTFNVGGFRCARGL